MTAWPGLRMKVGMGRGLGGGVWGTWGWGGVYLEQGEEVVDERHNDEH